MAEKINDGLATQALADAANTTTATEVTEETTPEPTPQEGDAQTTEETKEEGTETEGEGEEQTGAPEEYAEFNVSTGEDIGYKISDDQKQELVKFGKDNNLTDKQMESMINLHIERTRQEIEGKTKSDDVIIADYKKDGIQASRKEHGEKFAAMDAQNKLAFTKFFSEEARTHLDGMGISNQPWFFNALSSMNSVISEDVTVPGAPRKQGDLSKRSLAQACTPKT